ncbi:MAG TPA: DUF6356 family protein [Acidimicrobiales bacterium]|jgi:hypothetical protein|nr:DUF6356 family protein [Acidimicrobiales bacterium]|tara:strand:+ start:1182 stop:1478 length:297 start_codon:yes stop_codon:yes gene_type:complete
MPRIKIYDLDMAVQRYFTEHPASVGETYGEHFRVASHFAKELAAAAIAAACHAILPSLFPSTASSKVRRLHAEMTAGLRGKTNEDDIAQEAEQTQPVA